MKTVIVNSEKDPAGSNIRDSLLDTGNFAQTGDAFDVNPVFSNGQSVFLATSKNEIVFVEGLDEHFGKDEKCSYILISKHRAESGIPSLTAHFTGNYSRSDFGGRPGELSYCDPYMLKSYMRELIERRNAIPSKFNITIEATHHGPTSLHYPVLFVELGSGPTEWEEKDVSVVIAEALLASLPEKHYPKCAVGLGGTHYSEKFNQLVLDSDICLGHVIPKYALDNLDEALLRQAVAKSVVPITVAALDWKGLGKQKQKILDLVEKLGLETMKL